MPDQTQNAQTRIQTRTQTRTPRHFRQLDSFDSDKSIQTTRFGNEPAAAHFDFSYTVHVSQKRRSNDARRNGVQVFASITSESRYIHHTPKEPCSTERWQAAKDESLPRSRLGQAALIQIYHGGPHWTNCTFLINE